MYLLLSLPVATCHGETTNHSYVTSPAGACIGAECTVGPWWAIEPDVPGRVFGDRFHAYLPNQLD